jgi:hypothetical protein
MRPSAPRSVSQSLSSQSAEPDVITPEKRAWAALGDELCALDPVVSAVLSAADALKIVAPGTYSRVHDLARDLGGFGAAVEQTRRWFDAPLRRNPAVATAHAAVVVATANLEAQADRIARAALATDGLDKTQRALIESGRRAVTAALAWIPSQVDTSVSLADRLDLALDARRMRALASQSDQPRRRAEQVAADDRRRSAEMAARNRMATVAPLQPKPTRSRDAR